MSSASMLQMKGNLLPQTAATQLVWYAAGALIAFLIPFIFSSELNLDHNFYYLVYFAAALSFLAAYAQATS